MRGIASQWGPQENVLATRSFGLSENPSRKTLTMVNEWRNGA